MIRFWVRIFRFQALDSKALNPIPTYLSNLEDPDKKFHFISQITEAIKNARVAITKQTVCGQFDAFQTVRLAKL